ncbi:MAG TPA: TIGR00153 family protein [Planctomycetes bacterium]|nr:TIGR00153 family protein [Planctomycetota bacterium]
MSFIGDLFGKSPFGPLVEHTKKVHECVEMIRPLAEALVKEDYEEIHRLQDSVCKVEYQADQIKHEIRELLPRRYFMPVASSVLEDFLHYQDKIADSVQDFAVILLIRQTKLHPALREEYFGFVDQILKVSRMLLSGAEELQELAETSFGGAEATSVLERIRGVGEEEWKADRLQRVLSKKIYSLEKEIDPVTIMFYDKMLRTLSSVANEAENTAELLRRMILHS